MKPHTRQETNRLVPVIYRLLRDSVHLSTFEEHVVACERGHTEVTTIDYTNGPLAELAADYADRLLAPLPGVGE